MLTKVSLTEPAEVDAEIEDALRHACTDNL
jgi:hypothetical protein